MVGSSPLHQTTLLLYKLENYPHVIFINNQGQLALLAVNAPAGDPSYTPRLTCVYMLGTQSETLTHELVNLPSLPETTSISRAGEKLHKSLTAP